MVWMRGLGAMGIKAETVTRRARVERMQSRWVRGRGLVMSGRGRGMGRDRGSMSERKSMKIWIVRSIGRRIWRMEASEAFSAIHTRRDWRHMMVFCYDLTDPRGSQICTNSHPRSRPSHPRQKVPLVSSSSLILHWLRSMHDTSTHM